MDLNEVIMNSAILGRKRIAKSANDFGDDATVGLQLKRLRKTMANYEDHDFAFYLGMVNGKFHVGTHEIGTFMPTKLESFDNLDDLKREWELD